MALWIDEYCSELKEYQREDRILRGVIAYVEVWSGKENRCDCVKTELKSLGALVEDRFSAKVKFVVFNEGSLTTYKKAKKRNIPLVSVLWIEESKRLMKRACVKSFCALHLDRYEEPDIFSSQTKFKRPRHSLGLSSKHKARQRKKQKTVNNDKENDSYETYFNPQIFNENAAMVKDGIISTLEHVTGKIFSENEEEDSLPCSQFTSEINKPLTKKLYNRFLEEVKEDVECNNEERMPLRQSCPPLFGAQNEENSSDSSVTIISNEVDFMSINVKSDSDKQSTKCLQVPITFFFQASSVPNKCPTVVFTGFQYDEVDMLTNVVYNIGGFQVEKLVSSRCTHVICGYPPKRTLNILCGVARGCWILSKEWVLRSLEHRKWLDEEEFELNYFLPAIKKARISRQNGPPFHHRSLFSSCGPIYVSNGCSPPASNLKELISLCGGQVVTCTRAARVVVVGQGKSNLVSISQRLSKAPNFVTEKWILDSISEDSLRPFDHPYLVIAGGSRKSSA